MRFYSIVNMYMAGIHAGIQTAHAVHTMGEKYHNGYFKEEDREASDKFYQWMLSHKTIYVKHAGDHDGLEQLYTQIRPLCKQLEIPHVKWRESQSALRGSTTALGLVLPEEVYNYTYTGPMTSLCTNGFSTRDSSVLDYQYEDDRERAIHRLNQLVCHLRHAV